MPKARKTISVRIPPYAPSRLDWRRQIRAVVAEAQEKSGVAYSPTDRLEVLIRFYFAGRALGVHDLDNRMKDIFDALQGRCGGSKRIRPVNPCIPNDHQVWRVVAEKAAPPKQSRGGLGHLKICLYKPNHK